MMIPPDVNNILGKILENLVNILNILLNEVIVFLWKILSLELSTEK